MVKLKKKASSLCFSWPPVYWSWETCTLIIQLKWRTSFDACQGNSVGNIGIFFISPLDSKADLLHVECKCFQQRTALPGLLKRRSFLSVRKLTWKTSKIVCVIGISCQILFCFTQPITKIACLGRHLSITLSFTPRCTFYPCTLIISAPLALTSAVVSHTAQPVLQRCSSSALSVCGHLNKISWIIQSQQRSKTLFRNQACPLLQKQEKVSMKMCPPWVLNSALYKFNLCTQAYGP